MKKKDLTGQKFGRLTVLEEAEKTVYPNKSTVIRWRCRCDCGGMTVSTTADLTRGHATSCGCYQRQRTGEASRTHGLRYTKVYHTWLDMKDRCNNPKNKRYKDWGGRGISVCDDWQKDFMTFYEYVSALANFGEPGYSIDRIDNNGNYEPGNVRWAERKTQANNTRRQRKGQTNGITD